GGGGPGAEARGEWSRLTATRSFESPRRLPQFEPVPFRIDDPAEPPEFGALRPFVHRAALAPKRIEHVVEIVDPIVDHERRGAGLEVPSALGKDAPHQRRLPAACARRLSLELHTAPLLDGETEVLAIPCAQ